VQDEADVSTKPLEVFTTCKASIETRVWSLCTLFNRFLNDKLNNMPTISTPTIPAFDNLLRDWDENLLNGANWITLTKLNEAKYLSIMVNYLKLTRNFITLLIQLSQ